MATVYNIKITSHWINYHPNDLRKMLEKALDNGTENRITIGTVARENE